MAKLIYIIPDEKLDEFKKGFLKCQPTPNDMTDNEWIKKWGRIQFMQAYRIGKQQLAREQASVESELII